MSNFYIMFENEERLNELRLNCVRSIREYKKLICDIENLSEKVNDESEQLIHGEILINLLSEKFTDKENLYIDEKYQDTTFNEFMNKIEMIEIDSDKIEKYEEISDMFQNTIYDFRQSKIVLDETMKHLISKKEKIKSKILEYKILLEDDFMKILNESSKMYVNQQLKKRFDLDVEIKITEVKTN